LGRLKKEAFNALFQFKDNAERKGEGKGEDCKFTGGEKGESDLPGAAMCFAEAKETKRKEKRGRGPFSTTIAEQKWGKEGDRGEVCLLENL